VLKMLQLLCERRIFTVNAEHRGGLLKILFLKL